MSKIIVRLLFLAVLTLGPTASSALLDGGSPVPTCNPFTQNCNCGPSAPCPGGGGSGGSSGGGTGGGGGGVF